MGGVDKGLQDFRGKRLIDHVYARLAPQVGEVIINANQNFETYGTFGARVVSDAIGGHAGPLAGLHAGLSASQRPYIASVPCDSPFLPVDLVARLYAGLESSGAELAVPGRANGSSRCSASRAATCTPTSIAFSNPAAARSTPGMRRCASPRSCSTTKPTRFPISTPAMNSRHLKQAVSDRITDLPRGITRNRRVSDQSITRNPSSSDPSPGGRRKFRGVNGLPPINANVNNAEQIA